MIIDVHAHVTPPELMRRYPMPPALGDVEGMLEKKAEVGIDVSLVGSPVGFATMLPVPGLDIYAQSLDDLKALHDWIAETCRSHEGQLYGYAFCDPFGGDAWLEQTAETMKDGWFVGLIVNTSVKGEYLNSPAADDFFAMVAELRAPLFLHPPAEPSGCEALRDFRIVELVARFNDIALGLAALVFGARFERDPNLRVVAAGAGGSISLLADRLDSGWRRHQSIQAAKARRPIPGPPHAEWPELSRPPSAYLRDVYVDSASFSADNHIANLRLMGAQKILFGTDSPPVPKPFRECLRVVEDLPVSDEDRAGILSGNARELFNLPA